MQTSSNTEYGFDTRGEGNVIHTRSDTAIDWLRNNADKGINFFRKNSLWPMPMGLACCAIELMAAGASRFRIALNVVLMTRRTRPERSEIDAAALRLIARHGGQILATARRSGGVISAI